VKRKILPIVFALFTISSLTAQITVSGILDSTVSMSVREGNFSFGIEEYANLRFQSRIRDRAVVFGAVNLIAAAGEYAAIAAGPMNITAYVGGENYIAAIELERLHFRLNFETADFNGGLMRLPFGYSQVWGPSDFLNPKNPLKPDARPRAVLGAGLSWYPADEIKVLGFCAAPRNPFLQDGSGILAGISMDRDGDKASIQSLYSFEMPTDGSANGIHRIGFSVKADFEAGFVVDMLYTYNHEIETRIDGLSFSIGADYSFFDGNMLVLAEYLYNGENSSTAFSLERNIFGFPDRHYLYTGLTWRFNDFTNLSAAFISGFDDFSLTPVFTLNHDLFQGATLTITMRLPVNRDEFDDLKMSFNCGARLRLRF
jgi:hypothetical protein